MALCAKFPKGYKHSYWHDLGTEPMHHLTVGQLVDIAAERWTDGEAFVSVYEGLRLTFGEAREQADRLAAGLLQLGLSPGDRMGVWGSNSTSWYISRLAAARGGFICVQINGACQAPEMVHSLTRADVKALIFSEFYQSNSTYQIMRNVIPELDSYPEYGVQLQSSKVPLLQFLIVMGSKQYRGTHKFDDIIKSGSPESFKKIKELQTQIQPDDVCSLQYSSGTTGYPKAAIMTHHIVVNNGITVGKHLELNTEVLYMCVNYVDKKPVEESDSPLTLERAQTQIRTARHIICTQFSHTSSSIGGIICGLYYGNTLIIPAPIFDAQKTLVAIQQERGTHISGSPAVYVELIASAAKLNVTLTTVKVAASGGNICSQKTAKDIRDKLNIRRVCPVYGMTEIGYSFAGRPGDSVNRMTDTVGCVCDHIEAKIVDVAGQMVPSGSPGELWIRGYSVMPGYWGEKEKTDELIRPDGWLKTGDLFALDEDGYGRFVGRVKDVIVRVCENIFPVEMEEFFMSHPDVMETAVFGVPDLIVGEEICVYLRLKDGIQLSEADIVKYCSDKIADYKIPRYIRFAKDFPRSPMGKILKPAVRNALLQELSAAG